MTDEAFTAAYGARLNEQQLQAVRSGRGQTLLLAVPGSGKTTVLVTRLGYLIHCLGVDPEQILTMTYTVAATREMSARFHALFGPNVKSPEIRTINGLAQKVITFCSESEGRPAFELEDNEGKLSGLIRDLYRKYYRDYPPDSTIRDIRTAITYFKNSLRPRSELDSLGTGLRHFPEIYDEYNTVLRRNRKMDYDDQLLYARTILQSRRVVREAFQKKFQWVCVDEAQDTSRLQHDIIHAITGDRGNLFMVGDEDQSIYGFRAACPEALLQFRETYPDSQVLLLEENYRSTKEIVEAANKFVRQCRARTPKEMRPNREDGVPTEFIRVIDRSAQYRYLLALIQKDPGTIAVLFRNNDSAVPLIDLFQRHGIDFRCRRFDDVFFSHRILTDISDIIHFSLHDSDSECFMRIYYKLGCMISRTAAEYACEKSSASGKPILHELIRCPELSQAVCASAARVIDQLLELQKDTALQGLRRIRYQIGYGSYIEQNQLDTGKFVILEFLAEKLASPTALLQRLEELRKLIREHADTDTRVVLSTIHSAKGLEFDRVWMLDMFDGILPQRTKEQAHTADELRDYEEDRRLFYVGMTRARTKLSMFICSRQNGEFTQEIQKAMPAESFEDSPALAFIGKDFCGSGYSHHSFGHGIIQAQAEDSMLVGFDGAPPILLGINEMIRERRRLTKTSTAAPDQRSTKTADAGAGLKTGARVFHSHFGNGTITDLFPDKLLIRFDNDNAVKTFLKSALSDGKIRMI